MSLITIKTYDDNAIAPGKMIVLDNLEAREFDEKNDALADVVGVSYSKLNNGRLVANVDGFAFNDADYYTFSETLEPDYNAPNSNYDPGFNPAANSAYIFLATNGMVSVDNTYTAVPSNFKKIKTQTNYDLYIII